MMLPRLSACALALASLPVLAGDLDLSLTNDSVKFHGNAFNAEDQLQLGAGYTYHEGSRNIVNLDVHAQGRSALGNLPATAGIGIQGLAWDDNPGDGGGIGIGGYGTLNIPAVPGLSVYGALHYSPSILSYGDSRHITNLELRSSYRVIRNAEVFAGYRYLNTDLEGGGDINLDEGILGGIKIFF